MKNKKDIIDIAVDRGINALKLVMGIDNQQKIKRLKEKIKLAKLEKEFEKVKPNGK